jgi:hypothetical protein
MYSNTHTRAQDLPARPRERRRLRASDADREVVAEALRGHHAAGRLHTGELEARAECCYAAATVGELDELLSDLPHTATPPSERTRARVEHAHRWAAVAVAVAAGLVLGILCALGAAHLLWIAAIPAGIALKRHLPCGHHASCRTVGCGQVRVPAMTPRHR